MTSRALASDGDTAGYGGFFVTRLDAAAGWCRANSVWPLPLGLACCAIEFMATAASRFDVARFGMEVARFSPRQADLLIVAGWLSYKTASVMTTLYDQMSEPKWVVAMGACASSGGMHRAYPVVQGIDEFIPVDIYVPGCPPRPEALLNALIHLQERIGREPRVRSPQSEERAKTRESLLGVAGRGEMTPPALASPHERWVEGSKPRVGATPDFDADETDAPPPRVSEAAVSVLRSAGARWSAISSDASAVVPLRAFAPTARRLKEDAGFSMLVDHTAIDYPDRRPRFTVVAILGNPLTAERLHLRTRAEEEQPVPTLADVYEAANWAERETYDMFGIPFEGHPDLTRILMPSEYDGWPARRDFPCEGHLRFRD